jgi:hypothetical protein
VVSFSLLPVAVVEVVKLVNDEQAAGAVVAEEARR